MFNQAFKLVLLFLVSSILAACMNLGHVSYRQAHMLKKEGFVLTNEGWSLALPESLLFKFNDATIDPKQASELVRLSNQLNKYRLDKLKIIGHTDNIGEATYNQQLSLQRATSVSNIFLEHGFKSTDLRVIGKGSSQPLVENNSDENRAKNRRVTVVIIP